MPMSVLAGFFGAHPLTNLQLLPEEEWGGWIPCELGGKGRSGMLKRKEVEFFSSILSSVGDELG